MSNAINTNTTTNTTTNTNNTSNVTNMNNMNNINSTTPLTSRKNNLICGIRDLLDFNVDDNEGDNSPDKGDNPRYKNNKNDIDSDLDTCGYYCEEGSYAMRNDLNEYYSADYDFDDVSSYSAISVISVSSVSNSSTSSMEDPNGVELLDQLAFKIQNTNLFSKHTLFDKNENLKFGTSEPINDTHQSKSSIMNPPIHYDKTNQLIKFNSLIMNYMSKPDGLFVMKGLIMETIPDILKTIDSIKCLMIEKCEINFLENLPPNIETLDVRYNNITSLTTENLPSTLTTLNAHMNKINFVDLARSFNITTLNLMNNPLKEVIGLPPNVKDLNISVSDFSNSKLLASLCNLQILKMSRCNIDTIDDLPDTIIDLQMSQIRIFGGPERFMGHIHKLPKQLMKFICHSSHIRSFGFTEFPEGLQYLDLYDNEITHLPTLPNVMMSVEISNNMLMAISNIPTNIMDSFECTNNFNLDFTPEQFATIERLKKCPNIKIKIEDDWSELGTDYDIYSNQNQTITFGSRSNYHNQQNNNQHNQNNNQYNQNNNQHNQNNYQTNYQNNQYSSSIYDHNTQSNDVYSKQNELYSNSNSSYRSHDLYANSNTNNRTRQRNNGQGFGNFGSRNFFNLRYGGRNNDHDELGRQRSHYPPHIAKLMGHDAFIPTRDSKRKIIHQHIYTV